MASVWSELKRRNVVKVAVAYAIVGWLLVEVSSTVLPTFEAPQWVLQTITFVIILGFPLALILSWAYEITPEGMKRSHEVPATDSITHVTGRKIDFAIIGALVLALGFVVYNYVLVDSDQEAVVRETTLTVEPAAESPAPAVQEEERDVLPNSVAVLPFENLSPDPDNAYFAAGIHESVISQLARLRNLNVIARTSVMQYADSAPPVPDIAKELRVETVMEGSVRFADDQVLVTAQLIDGVTGVHLWVDEYRGDLSDIFGIQSDISMNIANALEAEFSLTEQEAIEKIPTASPAAYALYLRAISEPSSSSLRDQYLGAAIETDPEFALAYALRAYSTAYALTGFTDVVGWGRAVQDDVDRALAIDPTLGVAYAALGGIHLGNWRGAQAEEALRRASELSPKNAAVLVLYGRLKRYRGDHEEAIRLHTRALELDPNRDDSRNNLGVTYRFAKDYESAATTLQPCLNGTHLGCLTNLALAEAARGNHSEAVRVAQITERLLFNVSFGNRYSQIALAYGQAGRAEDAQRLFQQFEEVVADNPIGDGAWARAYIAIGDYEQALERVASAVSVPTPIEIAVLTEMAANAWSDPELDRPEFRNLLDGLWDRN